MKAMVMHEIMLKKEVTLRRVVTFLMSKSILDMISVDKSVDMNDDKGTSSKNTDVHIGAVKRIMIIMMNMRIPLQKNRLIEVVILSQIFM